MFARSPGATNVVSRSGPRGAVCAQPAKMMPVQMHRVRPARVVYYVDDNCLAAPRRNQRGFWRIDPPIEGPDLSGLGKLAQG